jgi:glycosyltransferase involved in cell wall biosynthesis
MVIRAGVDFQRFHSGVNGDEIRKKYGIGQDDTLLFFVGWLYHFSGLKEVVVELSKIKRDDIKLLIVGDGDGYDDLKQMMSDYHLENKMIMTGKQPYDLLPQYLAAADICLLPAYNNEIMRDIVPIKMYEYMAMGNPVIATRLPGIEKEFGDDNGIIFINNSNETVNRSLELIEKGVIISEGKKARKFIEKNDWNKITDDFEKVLKELI